MFNYHQLNDPSHQGIVPSEPNPVFTGTASNQDIERQLARLLERVPPFLRLPAPKARCRFTGLSRTALIDLIAPSARNGGCPPVKAIYRKTHRHAVRGVWLIPAENLFRFLLSQADRSAEEYTATMKHRPQGDHDTPSSDATGEKEQGVQQ